MRTAVTRTLTPLTAQVRWSSWNLQLIQEAKIPDYAPRPNRGAAEVEELKKKMPELVFVTSHEHDLVTKTRTNIMGEWSYQRNLRLKVAELVLNEAPQQLKEPMEVKDETQLLESFKTLQNLSEYSGDLLELHNQSAQRVNDFVDSNPPFLLEQPLREEARWNEPADMDLVTRAQVRNELREWLPTELQQRRAADVQTVAAFSPSVRKNMLDLIDKHRAESMAEIKALPQAQQPKFIAILEEEVAAGKRYIDPTLDITPEAIAKASLSELRDMAHRVSEFNWDSRMIAILGRASELSKDEVGARLVKQMKEVGL
eukprot:NODE_2779_length_1093_cov_952.962733_g2649_i0.p1 GENE.NODE_2779_length_1093_cov_952.962733_g2649_i0~~NODE_2779_length_1093_cov_952.962733_g2649_i0.p1  ORF type:complete len:314 (-),score=84.09 NODE_2779_length_1093_cov_952.962733_g2649_i0:96-1037(-)